MVSYLSLLERFIMSMVVTNLVMVLALSFIASAEAMKKKPSYHTPAHSQQQHKTPEQNNLLKSDTEPTAGGTSRSDLTNTSVPSTKSMRSCIASYLPLPPATATTITALYFLEEATTPPDTSVWYWVSSGSFAVQTIIWAVVASYFGLSCMNS